MHKEWRILGKKCLPLGTIEIQERLLPSNSVVEEEGEV
jgi:hypothetical protein